MRCPLPSTLNMVPWQPKCPFPMYLPSIHIPSAAFEAAGLATTNPSKQGDPILHPPLLHPILYSKLQKKRTDLPVFFRAESGSWTFVRALLGDIMPRALHWPFAESKSKTKRPASEEAVG